MSAYGCVSALFQLAFFPRLVARFGPGRVVVATAVAFGVLYALFPFENMLARDSGTASAVWPLIVLQLVTISVSDMGLSCSVGPDCGFASTVFFEGSVFMFVSSAAPHKRSLGALNGLSQTVVSTQRAVGPVAAAALFASSLHNMSWADNLRTQFYFPSRASGCVAVQLPRNTWKPQHVAP